MSSKENPNFIYSYIFSDRSTKIVLPPFQWKRRIILVKSQRHINLTNVIDKIINIYDVKPISIDIKYIFIIYLFNSADVIIFSLFVADFFMILSLTSICNRKFCMKNNGQRSSNKNHIKIKNDNLPVPSWTEDPVEQYATIAS